MSLVINTKTNVLKDGTTKSYHYVYIQFGEGPKELHNCGRVEDPQSWEKALEKVKEIYEREYWAKVENTKQKINEYMKTYIDSETSFEREITYDLFLSMLVEETEKWIDVNNPHRSIASIPALREIICKKFAISDNIFDNTLLELHKHRIVWCSSGISGDFKGKPLVTEFGDKWYAFTIYKKEVPATHSGRILERNTDMVEG